MAKAVDRSSKEGDPLKMYTIVMALLVVVMAVLFKVIDDTREDYALANKRLVRSMRFLGKDRDSTVTPITIPDLAWEVESLSNTYREAAGGGGLETSVSTEMMENLATNAGLRQKYAGRERRDPSQEYETITMKFDYLSRDGSLPHLWQLINLVYSVERLGRYRVSELSWDVADATENPDPPFDVIKPPQIQVALRVPKLE